VLIEVELDDGVDEEPQCDDDKQYHPHGHASVSGWYF
jgi:hypothetical protein